VVANAQVERINVKVESITCSLCFTIAQTSLHQLQNVDSVSADAKSGRIEINTKPGVSVKDVMDRVKVAGFKRGNDFEITVNGKLEKRGNRLVLVAPGQKELFIVEPNSKSRMAANMAEQNSEAKIVGSISGSGNQYNLNVLKMSTP
jgi:copper chaperone CopZ